MSPRLHPPEANLYSLLGVEPTATAAEVSAAYRQVAKVLHPDVSGTQTTAAMAALNVAREWLLDPDRRLRYDQSRGLGQPSIASARQRGTGWDADSQYAEPRTARRGPTSWRPPPAPTPRPGPARRSAFWHGLAGMPPTQDFFGRSPFPRIGVCPVCWPLPKEHAADGRPASPEAQGHCALGHVGQFAPRYGRRTTEPIAPDEHFDGHPYPSERQALRHEGLCPWAAGGGLKSVYYMGPYWDVPDVPSRVVAPDRELEAFLYPSVRKKVVREAMDAAEAGCVAIAVEQHNWVASVFAGRWAYDVRIERGPGGLIAKSWCNCKGPDNPCVHAVATWIVWAAGAVSPRPPRPRPEPTAQPR